MSSTHLVENYGYPLGTQFEELPPGIVMGAHATLNLLEKAPSCEIMVAHEPETGLLLDAMQYIRARTARQEGRPKGDPGMEVIPAQILDGEFVNLRHDRILENHLAEFERRGGHPGSKLLVVESTGIERATPHSQSYTIDFLRQTMANPDRIKVAFIGTRRVKGMGKLARQLAQGIKLSSRGVDSYFDPMDPSRHHTPPITHTSVSSFSYSPSIADVATALERAMLSTPGLN